jgi:hypothetical protein
LARASLRYAKQSKAKQSKAKQSKESIAGRFRQGCWRVVPALQVSYQTVEQQQASGFICVNEKHALVEPAE